MSAYDVDSISVTLDLFDDPPDFYPPSPTPTTETHTLLSGKLITVRLVGHSPLWGHHLWNAGRLISTYLESNPHLVASKNVLELGAGAGLPSLVCAEIGAAKVVVTDYPDPELVENLQWNIDAFYEQDGEEARRIFVEGFCWGAEVVTLLRHLPPSWTSNPSPAPGFDVLILADLLFNHSEHAKLVATIQSTLKKDPDGKALVFFTPYRPWLYEKDLAFFNLIREVGMVVEKVLEDKMDKVMFEEDRGNEELRRTVFGYIIRWKL